MDTTSPYTTNPVNPVYKPSKTNRILKWLILLAIVLFITAIIIFLFGKPSFSENQVILDIEGPTQASVGDEVTYKVKYGNNTKTDLHDLKFTLTYPKESIVIRDDEILDDESETFTIDTLSNGESGEMEFKAFLVGDRGNIKDAKITLDFRAGNLRSSFQKNKTISTTLVSVPVSLTLVAPPTITSGQTVTYMLDYRNESDDSISDIRFVFEYPDGFVVSEQTPRPSGTNTWSIPVLRRNEGGRISVKGVLSGNEGEVKTASVLLKRNINEEFVNYQKSSASSFISNPLLNVEVFANGSGSDSVNLGDRIRYTIRYKNNSNSNLIGLNLQVQLEGEMYDFDTLDTKGGFYDSSGGTILWNASVVPDFSVLPPNKSGEVEFTVKIKDDFPTGGIGSRNFFVKATSRLSTPNVPSGTDGNEVTSSSDLVTRITTRPKLSQTAFYNDPAFGSSGPLPPETGQETTFTIHWQLENSGNDMNNVEVKGVLPPGVVWKDIVSVDLGQNEPTFNPNSSEVIWNVGILPQGTGTSTSKYRVSFQVSTTPSVAGQVPTIIKDTRFFGIDSFTKEEINLNVSNLTADDLVDRPGEGTVE